MSKVAVVYWSGTGNTEAMADLVAQGVRAAGGTADLVQCNDFSADRIADFDAFAFGCPAMGDETLEEMDFEPMFSACKGRLAGKSVGLFGSYGWGSGDWMRTWEKDCDESNIGLAVPSVICCEAPDETALEACRAMGKALAQ